MISIHCTQCRQHLEIDEGFAGGVCRCQYCGTIQTVPSHLKNGSSAGSSPAPKATKTLYKKRTSGQSPAGTGLDELAEVVASSGLARGSLSKPLPYRGPPTEGDAPARRNPMLPILIGAGGVILALLMLVAYLALRPSAAAPPPIPVIHSPPQLGNANPSQTTTQQPQQIPTPAPVAPAGPSFAGIPLPSGSVVYLIDRSQANDEVLETLKAAVYKSVASLGPDRKFQIIFWHRVGENIVSYPNDGLAPAAKSEADAAAKRFEDVVAYGTTDLKPTFEKALAANPDVIVIATAKGFTLEESNVQMVADALKGKHVTVHTLSLGEAESTVLKQIAASTGGVHREMPYNQLRSFAN